MNNLVAKQNSVNRFGKDFYIKSNNDNNFYIIINVVITYAKKFK